MKYPGLREDRMFDVVGDAQRKRLRKMAGNGVQLPRKTKMKQTWKMEHEEGDITLECEVGSGEGTCKAEVVMECPRLFTLTQWEAEKLAKALVDVKNFGSLI